MKRRILYVEVKREFGGSQEQAQFEVFGRLKEGRGRVTEAVSELNL
jgi:hypothetical protein